MGHPFLFPRQYLLSVNLTLTSCLDIGPLSFVLITFVAEKNIFQPFRQRKVITLPHSWSSKKSLHGHYWPIEEKLIFISGALSKSNDEENRWFEWCMFSAGAKPKWSYIQIDVIKYIALYWSRQFLYTEHKLAFIPHDIINARSILTYLVILMSKASKVSFVSRVPCSDYDLLGMVFVHGRNARNKWLVKYFISLLKISYYFFSVYWEASLFMTAHQISSDCIRSPLERKKPLVRKL